LLIYYNVLLAQQTTVFKLPFHQQYKTLNKIINKLALQDPKAALRRLKKLELRYDELIMNWRCSIIKDWKFVIVTIER
jgi:hypothetical protein